MSTRCQIGFYQEGEKDLSKFDALIYRHSDGYPEGVLPDIAPFLKRFPRRGDSEYTSARLLQYMCNQYDEHTREFAKANKFVERYSGLTGELGHGISKSFHGDIEYLYAIYPKKVVVYATEFNFGDGEGKDINQRATRIKTVKV